MGKAFGYERGFVNYIFGSVTGNPIAMYIYGAGLLALWNALSEIVGGTFITAAFDYFLTKYLPPTSVEQVFVQVFLGAFVAAAKWYAFTPSKGRRSW